jgi:uncharacterized protein (UPF0276 family)
MVNGIKPSSLFPALGVGLGLRTDHYNDVLEGRSKVSWFEAISENYMDDGGRPLHFLTKIREMKPIVLHGVSLSIASTDPLDKNYLKRLKRLIDRIDPAIVSDHCCWTGVNGQNVHDLMPVPFNEEAIQHIANRVDQVQEILGRRIMLENVSSYMNFKSSEMTEWEFLTELTNRADCGLLLDVNNVYVSSVNHQFDPMKYIGGVPAHRVGQIHLAGHSECVSKDGTRYLVDTHDHPVCDDVWSLYEKTTRLLGNVNTMVEWDAEIPDYSRLEEEVLKAQRIQTRMQNEK